MTYWTPHAGECFLVGSVLKNVEKYGKTVVLRLFYSGIGEILNGWLWPDWTLYNLEGKDALQMMSNCLYISTGSNQADQLIISHNPLTNTQKYYCSIQMTFLSNKIKS